MELQSQLNGESNTYFSSSDYDTNNGNDILVNDFKLLPLRTDENPYCNYWIQSYSGSYAMAARIRLETLKSKSSSLVPTCTMNESMYSYDFSKDIWEIGRSELSALDSVDLIDVEGEEEEDEESWLYVSSKEFTFEEKNESALRWCRHVLDNRSPEMEAACLKLINRLNLKLSSESRHPGLQQTGTFSLDLSEDQTSFSRVTSNCFDHIDHDMSLDSNYKLQNITDVYDVARIQEASLRQENVYTLRCNRSPLTLPLCSYTTTNITTHRNRTEPCSSVASVPVNQSARMKTEKNCLSPKVTRFHEYKMLKRAQNQGASSRSRSPMRTSLRSLQAVRSSRSLDIDHYDPDQILHVRPGASSARTDSSYRSASHSADHMEPVQPTAIKRCQRSQRSHSLSPCRIPHPSISSAETFCSSQKRGASWVRSGRHLQR